MLSLSLRRKSAPGSANVRDRSLSPARRYRPSFTSLSSRRSLISLFNAAQKDQSLRGPEEVNDNPTEEKAQSSVNDLHDPQRNPEATAQSNDASIVSSLPKSRKEARRLSWTPSKQSSKRSQSRSRTMSTPKTFLDAIASKMKAATEFFHKSPARLEEDAEHDNEIDTKAPSFETSPKKSVRFRSYTSEVPGERKSSPIDIPQKTPPSLPPIQFSDATIANELAGVTSGLIMTARPPDTPILQAMEKREPLSIGSRLPSTSFSEQDMVDQLAIPTPLPGTNLPMDNPFDDAAATELQRCGSVLRDQSDNSNIDCSVAKHSNDAKSVSGSPALLREIGALLDQPQDDVAEYVSDASDDFGEIVNPFASSEDTAPGKFVLPFRGREELNSSFAAKLKAITPDNSSGLDVNVPPSPWSLESRRQLDSLAEQGSPNTDDADSESSDESVSAMLSQKNSQENPTHEDIRCKFKTKLNIGGPNTGCSRSSSTTDSQNNDYETTAEITQPEENEELFVRGHYLSGAKGHALEDNSLAQNIPIETDPLKIHTQERPSTASTVPPVVPEDCVSPLNLKANISSVSPSRTRRPFRFTNRMDESPKVSPIGNTSFSWQTQTSPDQTQMMIRNTSIEHTPLPVSIPLPLSVATKRSTTQRFATCNLYCDQHGWSPFSETLFCYAALAAKHVNEDDFCAVLMQNGGLAQFWMESKLPATSAPLEDTRKLSLSEAKHLIDIACKTSIQPPAPDLVAKFEIELATAFFMRPDIPGTTLGRFAVLNVHGQHSSSETSGQYTPRGSNSAISDCSDSDYTEYDRSSNIEKPKPVDCDEAAEDSVCQFNDITKSRPVHFGLSLNITSAGQSGCAQKREHDEDIDKTPKSAKMIENIRLSAPSPSREKCLNGGSRASESVMSLSTNANDMDEEEAQFVRGIL